MEMVASTSPLLSQQWPYGFSSRKTGCCEHNSVPHLSPPPSRVCRRFVALLRASLISRAALIALSLTVICCGSGCSSFHKADRNVVRTKVRRDRARAEKLTTKASEHIEAGENDFAAELLSKAIAADRTYSKAHNNMGLVHFAANDLFRAAMSFQEAMRFHPQCAVPLNNLGLTFESALRLDSAISYYESAHELSPKNPEYLGNLVRARLRAGEPIQALRPMLQQLYFVERRPEWVEWVQEQLMLATNPNLDRGPDSPDLSELNEENEEPFDESSRILYDSGPPDLNDFPARDDIPPSPMPASTAPSLPTEDEFRSPVNGS